MNQPYPALIRRLREKRGLKTFELAAKVERPSSFISRIETGVIKDTPPPEVLDAFEAVLGVSVAEQLTALGYRLSTDDTPQADDPDLDAIIEVWPKLTADQRDVVYGLVDVMMTPRPVARPSERARQSG